MRKVWIGALTVSALGLGAVLALPVLFKDRLVGLVVDQVNQRVDADVALGDVSVSVLPSFPDLTLTAHDLAITGKGAFEGVQLAKLGTLVATVDLGSLIGDGPPQLAELRLADGSIQVITDKEGRSNTDIAPADPAAPPAPEQPSTLELELEDYRLENLDLLYDDQQGSTRVEIKDLDHSGKGEIDGDLLHLNTRTDMAALTVASGGVTWLDQVKVGSDLELDLNQGTGAIRFGNNSLSLNDLRLGFEGDITPRGDDLDLDMKVAALETSFKSLLSLLPDLYKADFAGLQASGTLALNAAIKGLLPAEGEALPGFDLSLKIQDGRFQVPDLPAAVEAVNLDLSANHPGGLLDAMVLNVPRFALSVAGSPISGKLRLAHVDSDPDIDASIKGDLDLASLSKVYPVEGVAPQGRLDMDLDLGGRVSDFEASAVDKVRASGHFRLSNAVYHDSSLPAPLEIGSADLELSPATVALNSFSAKLGKTDLALVGRLDNAVAYALTDAPLRGQLTWTSGVLDLNPFLADDPAEASAPKAREAPESSSLVVIPANLDLSLDATAATVLYEDKTIRNAIAKLRVADQALSFEKLQMDVLDGTIGMKGSYTAKDDQAADVDMELTMATFEVAGMVSSFETLAKLAPVAKRATGKFRSGLTMKAKLNKDLSPDLASLASSGSLVALGIALQPGFMGKLADAVKNQDFTHLDLGDSELGFDIQKGRLRIQPTTVKVGGVKGTLKGTTGVLDETLDLVLNLDVPLAKIGASDLLSSAGLAGQSTGRLKVLVGGTFDNPTVKVDLGRITDRLEDTLTAALDEGKATVTEAVNEAVDAALVEAQKQADKLLEQARQAGQALKDQAAASGDQLREEAKKQAKKLKADAAGNPIKEAAAKEAGERLIKEANQSANKLEKEAAQKADALLAKAQKESDQLIAQASQKAKLK